MASSYMAVRLKLLPCSFLMYLCLPIFSAAQSSKKAHPIDDEDSRVSMFICSFQVYLPL